MQYKGESLGRYIRERKLLLAARDLRDTDQKVYDICLKYGFDSQRPLRVFSPVRSASRRELIAKKIIAERINSEGFSRLNPPARTSAAR